MNISSFENLMAQIAQGWNSKNPQIAVDCFTEDAIYIEPPDKQLIRGNKELYYYFGGDSNVEMKLIWRNLYFNENNQSGAGEYTFEMNGKTHHGVALVDIENDKIKFWREYDLIAQQPYEEFIGTDNKSFKFLGSELVK